MKWLRRSPGMESESFESDKVSRTGRELLLLLLSEFGDAAADRSRLRCQCFIRPSRTTRDGESCVRVEVRSAHNY
jgi:hypothetical protein